MHVPPVLFAHHQQRLARPASRFEGAEVLTYCELAGQRERKERLAAAARAGEQGNFSGRDALCKHPIKRRRLALTEVGYIGARPYALLKFRSERTVAVAPGHRHDAPHGNQRAVTVPVERFPLRLVAVLELAARLAPFEPDGFPFVGVVV